MQKANIKISYRLRINANSNDPFEREVLRLSLREYRLKSQAYDVEGVYPTFTQLKAMDGRANSLHYKTGFAVAGLMETLNKQIPVLRDTLDRSLPFSTWQFELVEVDLNDPAKQEVAIVFTTDWWQLLDVWNDHLLIAQHNDSPFEVETVEQTLLLQLQPGLSVVQYQSIPSAMTPLG